MGRIIKIFPVVFFKRTTINVLFFLTAWASILCAQSVSDDTCMMCHGRKERGAPAVDRDLLKNSAHGQNHCLDCHKDAGSFPHPTKLAPVSCSGCHKSQSESYLMSRHGQMTKQDRSVAAVCGDCHGTGHSILKSDDPHSPSSRERIVDTCARCHDDAKRMAFTRLGERDPVGSYRQTVHWKAFTDGNLGAAVCTDCHGAHALYNSLNPESRIFKRNIPNTCGSCHRDIFLDYRESVHGKAALNGVVESPVCTDCHGSHTIRSTEESGLSASAGAITSVCSECHESERITNKFNLPPDRVETYRNSYHGLAARRGDLRVANCASCHGYHDVLPSDNPRSSIYKANLSKTCGHCHPGAGDALSSGYVHVSSKTRHWSVSFTRWFYGILITFSVVFMLFHNGLDWFQKVRTGVRTTIYPDEIRMTVNERWQHGILVVVFVLLALTGFALRYSDARWAAILVPYDEALRRLLHRWAALVFVLLSIYHFFCIVCTKRGRFIVREMRPRWDDAGDMVAVFAYNLGIRKTPPVHKAFYRYPEKTEYWFLLWGSAVMVLTGSILVFNNFILRHFPLWVPELATTVHFYEASLACLAITIWHMYMVVFDPDVYPMNTAWWNGRIHGRERKRMPKKQKFFKKIPYGRF